MISLFDFKVVSHTVTQTFVKTIARKEKNVGLERNLTYFSPIRCELT